jgi:hypothetical protein
VRASQQNGFARGTEEEESDEAMSYDIYLYGDEKDAVCPHCDNVYRKREELFSANYTFNCGAMWRDAGLDIKSFKGRRADECLPLLQAALTNLEADPARFKAMNPPNGWGSYETSLPWLKALADAMRENPTSLVHVSY